MDTMYGYHVWIPCMDTMYGYHVIMFKYVQCLNGIVLEYIGIVHYCAQYGFLACGTPGLVESTDVQE